MGKRIKIIATIVCLTICLTALTFGVYAASSHTLQIQNRITFVADECNITITDVTIYKAAAVYSGQTVTNLSFDNVNDVVKNLSQNVNIPEYYYDNNNYPTCSFTQGAELISMEAAKPYLLFAINFQNVSTENNVKATVKNVNMPANLIITNQSGTQATFSSGTNGETNIVDNAVVFANCAKSSSIDSLNSSTLYVAFKLESLVVAISTSLLEFEVNFEVVE